MRGASIVLLVALATGCAPGAGLAPGSTGSGGSSAGGTGGSSGGGQCLVTILPVMPDSFLGLHPGDKLRVRAQAAGVVGASATWTWSVTAADGTPVPTTQPMADKALIDVVLPATGTYAINATYGPGSVPCLGAVYVTVAPPGARTAFFVFRLTPPSNVGWPAQQLPPVTVIGGTPSGNNVLKLQEGTPVVLTPVKEGTDELVSSYVRATETASHLFWEGHAAGKNIPSLSLPPGTYDFLVVPDGTLPPLLLQSRQPTDLASAPIVVQPGMPVTGQVTDATGAPVAGAHISLRAGALPSTLGTSDAAGKFTLYARPGTYGATVVPGASLPGGELSIAAKPGFTVDATAPARLALRLATLPTARIGLTVSGAGTGAKILVEARDPVAAAAMVEMAAGETTTMGAATLRIRAELPIAADGTVDIGPLPRGHYRATVFAAGAGPATATVTTIEDIDATAGDVQRSMQMATPVVISGTLRPGQSARTARVQAIDDQAPAAVAADTVAPFVTQADDAGAFSVKVNPSRRYRLIVDPPAGGPFARAMLPPVTVAGSSIAVGAQDLPPALLYAGRVVGPRLEPAPGTLVSVFCVATAATCLDSTRPIAETVTTQDGSFRVMLPDPGVGP